MNTDRMVRKLTTRRVSAALLLAAASLPGCSTIATTVGDYKTNHMVLSGARHNVKNLYHLSHTSVEELPIQTYNMLSLAFVDFPFSLAADILILPITIPYTLMNTDNESPPPANESSAR